MSARRHIDLREDTVRPDNGGDIVLVVEDDPLVNRLISRALTLDDIEVVAVSDPLEALPLLESRSFDLAVLDVLLPRMSGLDLCKRIVAEHSFPVVLVSARNSVEDVMRGLEAGAEDYIKKPFEIHDLRARVEGRLYRAKELHGQQVIDLHDLTIDSEAAEVRRGEQVLPLSMTEFRLLAELTRHRGEVISRESLLETVWCSPAITDTRMVDMAVRRLRTKIEGDPAHPRIVKTVRGVGYVID